MPLVKLTSLDAKNNHGAMTRKGMAYVGPGDEKTVDLTADGLKKANANPWLTVEVIKEDAKPAGDA